MPWMLAIPALISAGTSIAGMAQQAEANGQSKADLDKVIQQYIALKVPDPQQQKIALQRYQLTGELDPKLEASIKQDPTAFQGIVKNQQYSGAQDKALHQLQSLGEEGGLSLSDKADLQEQELQNSNKDKANREAITDQMARRGQGGSGLDLQAQLSGAQSAGDRNATSSLRTLGDARDRALKAISGAGSLAGQLGQQDYQRQSDLASARDRINQFNTTNAQSVQQRNVEEQNRAQAANLAARQKVSSGNVDLANQEEKYNKGLAQQQYEDQLQKTQGIAGAYGKSSDATRQNGATTAQQFGAVGSAIGQGGTAIQNQNNWDDWLKATTKKQPGVGIANGSDPDEYYGRQT